ncbi:sodium:solute symporter family protein [Cerasicoccus arenae]|uniref:Sodium:proline symporter n=1 Tax=Cerasicoccus arenae TaxID=424488 RepID=A0A8J3GD55_9BACT|nr:sodium:solute symporter family protein [Cerasicoccus arenae]MBK1860047.1 sodium:solute symporter family protein [Cerasicoccus arenae]GHB93231.1 sodium:proline symporter [Cerasicoccus arenae]
MTYLAITTEADSPFGAGGIIVVAIYLGLMIAFGLAGRFARKENSLGDFFLGGRSLGFFVLLMTLYATQYSGNTLIGYAGKAYRSGFEVLVSLPFMMAGIGFYLLYAPKLQRLSREGDFITLGDYIQRRYNHRWLTSLIALSGIVALGNFMITNLKAMGEMTAVVAGDYLTPTQGILILVVIILIYETLGGLRSVAWTDVLQGLLLLIGCTIIFTATLSNLGGVSGAADKLHDVRPDFWEPLSTMSCVGWVSSALIISLGFSLYPQAIQRIYAAKSPKVLRRSLQVMVFMPLVTTLLMVTIGVLGNIAHPGLDTQSSGGITMLVLGDYAASHPAAKWVVFVFVAAVIAAIMSTADSILLAIASSATQDFFRPLFKTDDQKKLTLLGKVISTGVMIICVLLATELPQSIWKLIEIKTELLAQTAPALICGLHFKKLRAGPVLAGFLAGTIFTLIFQVGSIVTDNAIPGKPFHIHAGLWGVLLNFALVWIGNCLAARNSNPVKQVSQG